MNHGAGLPSLLALPICLSQLHLGFGLLDSHSISSRCKASPFLISLFVTRPTAKEISLALKSRGPHGRNTSIISRVIGVPAEIFRLARIPLFIETYCAFSSSYTSRTAFP